jgi:phage terminase large subunit
MTAAALEPAVVPYSPRRWAVRFHESFKRWSVLVLHRRAGKTTAIINHHNRAATDDAWETARLRSLEPSLTDKEITELLRRRVYGHVMPTRIQAKTVAWEMLKYYAKTVPGSKPNESELYIKYPNGSRFYLFGADDPDQFRGTAFSGLSFDEYSQMPGNVFSEVLSKSLADHLGYAIFSGTIKGHDQLYNTYTRGASSAQWFALWQDIDASLQSEGGVTTKMLRRAMADDRDLVLLGEMSQEDFDQEWYLSPEAAIKGAIYGKEMAQARKDGRVTRVPYEPLLSVDTWWDLGMDDAMAIWFTQTLKSGEIRLIRYFEHRGEGIPFYVRMLRELPYVYGTHHAPFDIEVRELGTGRSRKETAAKLGLKFKTVDRIGSDDQSELEEGIHATRMLFPRLWFDQTNCQAGIDALTRYRRPWNQRLQQFMPGHVHDANSHSADALRLMGVGYKPPKTERRPARDTYTGNSSPQQTGTDWLRS